MIITRSTIRFIIFPLRLILRESPRPTNKTAFSPSKSLSARRRMELWLKSTCLRGMSLAVKICAGNNCHPTCFWLNSCKLALVKKVLHKNVKCHLYVISEGQDREVSGEDNVVAVDPSRVLLVEAAKAIHRDRRAELNARNLERAGRRQHWQGTKGRQQE